MPARKGTSRTICGVDADNKVRAVFVDENDNIVVNTDIRSQLAIVGGTSKYGIGVIENAGSNIYVVPAATTFYLTGIYLNITNESASPHFGYAYVYNNLAALKLGWRISAGAGEGDSEGFILNPPLEMSTGWYININSPAADVSVQVSFNGLEV